MTSMPAAHFGLWDRGLLRVGYAARCRRLRLRRVSTRSRRYDEPAPLRARRGEHVHRQRYGVVRRGRAHGARRPGRAPAAADDRPPLRSLLGPDGGDVGRDAEGRARLAEVPARTPPSTCSVRARRRAARQGRRDVGADVRDGEPRRDADVLPAGRAASCSRPPRTSSPRSRWGSWRSRASRPSPAVGGRRTDSTRPRSRSSSRASHAALLILENTHTRAGGTIALGRARPRPSRPRRSGTTAGCTSTARGSSTRPWRSMSRSRTSRRRRTRSSSRSTRGSRLRSAPCWRAARPWSSRRELMVHRLGGGTVHRAGIAAAAGLVALDTMVDRIADDHRRARELGRAAGRRARARPPAADDRDQHRPRRRRAPPASRRPSSSGCSRAAGVRVMERDTSRIRFVTHRLIGDEDVERAAAHRRRGRRAQRGAAARATGLVDGFETLEAADWEEDERTTDERRVDAEQLERGPVDDLLDHAPGRSPASRGPNASSRHRAQAVDRLAGREERKVGSEQQLVVRRGTRPRSTSAW